MGSFRGPSRGFLQNIEGWKLSGQRVGLSGQNYPEWNMVEPLNQFAGDAGDKIRKQSRAGKLPRAKATKEHNNPHTD